MASSHRQPTLAVQMYWYTHFTLINMRTSLLFCLMSIWLGIIKETCLPTTKITKDIWVTYQHTYTTDIEYSRRIIITTCIMYYTSETPRADFRGLDVSSVRKQVYDIVVRILARECHKLAPRQRIQISTNMVISPIKTISETALINRRYVYDSYRGISRPYF